MTTMNSVRRPPPLDSGAGADAAAVNSSDRVHAGHRLEIKNIPTTITMPSTPMRRTGANAAATTAVNAPAHADSDKDIPKVETAKQLYERSRTE
jgi:hypothetical protein